MLSQMASEWLRFTLHALLRYKPWVEILMRPELRLNKRKTGSRVMWLNILESLNVCPMLLEYLS